MLDVFSRTNYYKSMHGRFWVYIYGFITMFFIPMLLVVSWVNVFLANDNYSAGNYFETFILPTFILTLVLAVLTASKYAKKVHFTARKILFTVGGLLTIFLLIKYGIEFFGFEPLFITLKVPASAIHMKHFGVVNQYYTFSIPFSLTVTFILYHLSDLLLTHKHPAQH